MGYVPPVAATRSSKHPPAVTAALAASFLSIFWLALFLGNMVTLGGVPFNVLVKFWQDPIARNAYFSGNSVALHDRLDEMGIETEMKVYYRAQINDESVLDQHIHQILYDRTGYVGANYEVNPRGVLERRPAAAQVRLEAPDGSL